MEAEQIEWDDWNDWKNWVRGRDDWWRFVRSDRKLGKGGERRTFDTKGIKFDHCSVTFSAYDGNRWEKEVVILKPGVEKYNLG